MATITYRTTYDKKENVYVQKLSETSNRFHKLTIIHHHLNWLIQQLDK